MSSSSAESLLNQARRRRGLRMEFANFTASPGCKHLMQSRVRAWNVPLLVCCGPPDGQSASKYGGSCIMWIVGRKMNQNDVVVTVQTSEMLSNSDLQDIKEGQCASA